MDDRTMIAQNAVCGQGGREIRPLGEKAKKRVLSENQRTLFLSRERSNAGGALLPLAKWKRALNFFV